MKARSRRIRAGAVLLALTVFALAAFAAPAMAEYGKAKFDKTSMSLTTSGLTLEKNGGSAKTCTPKSAISGKVTESSYAIPYNVPFTLLTLFSCSGSTQLEMFLAMEAQRDPITGNTRVQFTDSGNVRQSPYGNYTTKSSFVSYTNGTGAATPSTINFSKTVIGSIGSENLTLSGTVNVMFNATETVKIVP